MEDLSLRSPLGHDNPSISHAVAWSYDDAVKKLSNLLNLEQSEAEYEIKYAVAHNNIHDPIPQDRFEAAMRHAQREPSYNISPTRFPLALIHFYLELQGITIELESSAPVTTPQTYLATLYADGLIGGTHHKTTLFFFTIEKCDAMTYQLIVDHRYEPRAAILGGRSSNLVTVEQARIAEFCLLTGLGPVEARDESEENEAEKNDARENLYNAVEKALRKFTKFNKLECALRLVQARLFPLKYNPHEITTALWDLGAENEVADPKYVVAREKYLINFFLQHSNGQHSTAVSAETAKTYLEENKWYMSPALEQWQAKVTTLSPLPPLDTTSPPDIQTIHHLIEHYEKTFPTRLPSDYQLESMIIHFKQGRLIEESSLRILRSHLYFRARKCLFANNVVKMLKLYKGAAVDISEWDPHQALGEAYRRRLGEIVLILKHNTNWFRAEKTEDGGGYEKPWLYVGNAMALGGKTDEQVKELISGMKDKLAEIDLAGASV